MKLLLMIIYAVLVKSNYSRKIRQKRSIDKFERQTESSWYQDAVSALKRRMRVKEINARAKNVVLFIGDGMGPTTVTAARILDGQNKGKTGEENVLSWEEFDNLGFSKTYNADSQVPDSAGTATAFMTGLKTKLGVINVNENAVRGDCASSLGQEILSLTMLAEEAGLSTGVVTTTRLTHATPSTGYAHAAERDWEHQTPDPRCKDIASQLIDSKHGDGLEVAFGGGRREFYTNTMEDPVEKGKFGRRKDGRNLTEEWVAKTTENNNFKYVYNAEGLRKLDPQKVDHVLGLFNYNHLSYSHHRKNATEEPSLPEMTEFAIAVLSRNPKGYFLLVEGGRIDHGHHYNLAFHAISDAVELNQAVHQARMLTKQHETLLIVTADHSHGFVVSGYQPRGNPIFGLTAEIGNDGKGWTTLGYWNGPGGLMVNESRANLTQANINNPDRVWQSLVPRQIATHGGEDVDETLLIVTADHSHGFVVSGYQPRGNPIFGLTAEIGNDGKGWTTLGYWNGPGGLMVNESRANLTQANINNPDRVWQSLVPRQIATHGGEDVGIYAQGPQAHLINGVVEQNYIHHVISYALCLTKDKEVMCREEGLISKENAAVNNGISKSAVIIYILSIIIFQL